MGCEVEDLAHRTRAATGPFWGPGTSPQLKRSHEELRLPITIASIIPGGYQPGNGNLASAALAGECQAVADRHHTEAHPLVAGELVVERVDGHGVFVFDRRIGHPSLP